MRQIATAAAALLLVLMPNASALRAQGAPPHAWLFGSWTGGLYPAPTQPTAALCLAHPVVIFTQDLVLRASLTQTDYVQRVIATARQTPRGAEIAFAPSQPPTDLGLLGAPPSASEMGFGCGNADLLRIERRGPNEITFPGCADFPNPLIRCPA